MRPVGTVRSVRTAVQAVIIVLVCCCLLTLNSGVAPWSAARPSALHNSAAAAAAAASQRRGMSSSAVVSGRGVSTVQGTDLLVVYVTAPNADVAEKIANKLVEQQLVACVNVLPGITSIYRWQGKVEKDSEVLMILKTQGALLDKLTAKVRELHPYDEPEVIGLPIIGGSPSYMQWVVDNTSP
eukprot:GHRR01006194.1.p1 GENE.GHRR01006194.1~~GHRR01006194.1.p1  ORF type:complete len:183 (+),score=52.40 GHRR01006194.1:129-677(+)